LLGGTRLGCAKLNGINLRTISKTKGNPMRTIAYGAVVEVGLVETGDGVEAICGDNRGLGLAAGEGFVWVGNIRQA
jgi:hypothetical protein